MNADRFTIDTDGGIFIQHPFAANMTVPQMFEGAIRQQARDLDQLRADLAAAVAERNSFRSKADSYGELFANYRLCIDERNELRARLAAIDNAPTVAKITGTITQRYFRMVSDAPDVGAELIARPAKD